MNMPVKKRLASGIVGLVLIWVPGLPSAWGLDQENQVARAKERIELSARDVSAPSAPAWRTLLISSLRTVKSDLTIPSNICLKFGDGGTCEVQEGATLTINGPMEAPLAQIF